MLEDVVRVIQKFLKKHPPEPDLLCNLTIGFGKLNMTEEAIATLEKWLAIEPNSPTAHAGLGLGYAMVNRPQDAYREIAEAIKLNEKVKDKTASEWIKEAIEILEGDAGKFLLLWLLMMNRMERKKHHRCFEKRGGLDKGMEVAYD